MCYVIFKSIIGTAFGFRLDVTAKVFKRTYKEKKSMKELLHYKMDY